MGAACGSCCSKSDDAAYDPLTDGQNLTEEEMRERRAKAAAAAEARSKNFQQGGGGEVLKAKQKRLEEAEKLNREKYGGGAKLQWQTG